MARDASGTYTLPSPVNPVIPGTIIATSWANPTLADVATALTDSLSRSGKGGMAAPLAMNGYRITNIGFATAGTDAPQAVQVRDQTFSNVTVTADSIGNNYVGTTLTLAGVPLNNGGSYNFLAQRDNTGPMTLSINGSAALPILLNGAPIPPGLVRTFAIVTVFYDGLSFRMAGVVAGAAGTVNAVQSTDPALISVANNTSTNISTLTPHANVAGGMTKLDSSGKVPVVQMPFTALRFIGIWNAAPGVNPPVAGNGDYYIVTVAGSLTLYRDSGGNVYTPQVTAVAVGAAIIYNSAGTPNQPTGWYWDPAAAAAAVASTTSLVPTTTLPAVNNVQDWATQMDPIIASKLPLAGGTMSGPIVQPLAPSTGTQLANRQYVDDKTAALVGVLSFNARTGSVALVSSDVTGALGYTPANAAGQAFGGTITAPNANFTGGVGALYFSPTYAVRTLAASDSVDFLNGQSQNLTLAAPTTLTSIDNVPTGSILRLIIAPTTHAVIWPANVFWPLGIAPSLAAGPRLTAIIVLEAAGGGLYASAVVY